VYVASPLGFTPAGRRYNEEDVLPALAAAGLEVLDPWLLTPEVDAALAAALVAADGPERRTSLAEVDRRIGEANAALIRDADGILAVLDGTDVDSGTAAEIGFAARSGKWSSASAPTCAAPVTTTARSSTSRWSTSSGPPAVPSSPTSPACSQRALLTTESGKLWALGCDDWASQRAGNWVPSWPYWS
jgi:nucleoside 2-deoxyribosyltransferase